MRIYEPTHPYQYERIYLISIYLNAVKNVEFKAILSCFSTERKEAESASLSAKEECLGRLIEGDQRGGGVAEDTSDNPHPHPPPPHPPLPLPPV